MKSIKSKLLIALLAGGMTLGTQLSAQSFTAFIETNQVFLSDGTPVGFGDVNVFFGTSKNTIAELNAAIDPLVDDAIATANLQPLIDALSAISWTAMGPGPNASVDWFSGFNIPAEIGDYPVLAIMDAAGPGALVPGSQIGFLASPAVLASEFTALTAGLGSSLPGATVMEVIVGTPGSITLTAVPEPAHFAMIFGALGLGFVLWRRRR
jgi:hypothetical protein